jgi:hypothetical protein
MSRLWKLWFLSLVSMKTTQRYILDMTRKKEKPLHILFCLVDHFEPGSGGVSVEIETDRITKLLDLYPRLVENHRDSGGNVPKRTWFFPPHYHRNNNLKRLVSLCETGFGEIELHLHHGKTCPDTPENLLKTIEKCVEEYSYFGIFGIENGKRRYAFIHGDWALDNSYNNRYCGVNNELKILRETGCYADFTFPSFNRTNPIKINSIYYAKGNPKRGKSYNIGCNVSKFGACFGDLMIIQGPVHLYSINGKWSGLRAMGDSINGAPPVTARRIDLWVKTGIHISGKKDWIIIKTHTHGAAYSDAVLGKEMDDVFTYLERKYNDRKNFILHYVTARELYNIIKAIESGEPGSNPEEYRNYNIKPPTYDSSVDCAEASEELKRYISKTYL